MFIHCECEHIKLYNKSRISFFFLNKADQYINISIMVKNLL